MILSQLLGTDISVTQLSDISQDLGTILGGNLGAGMLGQLLALIPKSNVWAPAGFDELFDHGDHSFQLTTSTSIHNHVSSLGGTSYSWYPWLEGYDNLPQSAPKGGFDFTMRGAIYGSSSIPANGSGGALPHGRWLVGLANEASAQLTTIGNNPFGSGTNNEICDTDNMCGIYMAFQLSEPRGDVTWKFAVSNWTAGAPFQDTLNVAIVETGMPAVLGELLDFKIKGEQGGGTIQWSIVNQTTGQIVSGEAARPSMEFGNGTSQPDGDLGRDYYPGFAAWNSSATIGPMGRASFMFLSAWVQNLVNDNVPVTIGI
jgi:hypothetical protein